MTKPKIITVCGSLKYKEELMNEALKLELAGNIVITPIFPLHLDKDSLTEEELNVLGYMHKEKIKLSDAIFVTNVNGYIGSTTKSEIAYAESLNKEIIYLEENK